MKTKRNIQITLEQAREWYKGDNTALKTLALSAFPKRDLKYSYEEIVSNVKTTPVCLYIPVKEVRKIEVLRQLLILSEAFNKDTSSESITYRWFIKGLVNNGIIYATHPKEKSYPGIIYFNKLDDLKKAVDIIGEDILSLF